MAEGQRRGLGQVLGWTISTGANSYVQSENMYENSGWNIFYQTDDTFLGFCDMNGNTMLMRSNVRVIYFLLVDVGQISYLLNCARSFPTNQLTDEHTAQTIIVSACGSIVRPGLDELGFRPTSAMNGGNRVGSCYGLVLEF